MTSYSSPGRFVLVLASSLGTIGGGPGVARATPAPAPAPAPAPVSEGPPLHLDVLLVNDPDFPRVTTADAAVILDAARATLADKLAFTGIEFAVAGETALAPFLSEYADSDTKCRGRFAAYRVSPNGRKPRDVPRDIVMEFLQRWKVDALRAFFPEARRVELATYDDIYAALMDEFARKLALIASFELKNGKSLLAPESMEQRSYVRWICAVRNQDEADLILTNAFILYDLGSEPYPHSIFAKNKVGGASLYSSRRRAIGSRAVVGSTFSMVTDLEFFAEAGVSALSKRERLEVIGTFIVAHELGHAVFKLPDFYDHPRECLMTTKYETGYVSGFRNIKKYPGACNECSPYVAAKRHVFAAQSAARNNDHTTAIAELKRAIRQTPKHIDGSYLRYIADLSVGVAESYAKLGDLRQARRWLKSALRISPKNDAAAALAHGIDESN